MSSSRVFLCIPRWAARAIETHIVYVSLGRREKDEAAPERGYLRHCPARILALRIWTEDEAWSEEETLRETLRRVGPGTSGDDRSGSVLAGRHPAAVWLNSLANLLLIDPVLVHVVFIDALIVLGDVLPIIKL